MKGPRPTSKDGEKIDKITRDLADQLYDRIKRLGYCVPLEREHEVYGYTFGNAIPQPFRRFRTIRFGPPLRNRSVRRCWAQHRYPQGTILASAHLRHGQGQTQEQTSDRSPEAPEAQREVLAQSRARHRCSIPEHSNGARPRRQRWFRCRFPCRGNCARLPRSEGTVRRRRRPIPVPTAEKARAARGFTRSSLRTRRRSFTVQIDLQEISGLNSKELKRWARPSSKAMEVLPCLPSILIQV
jgi:hypothetical protein